MPVGTLTNQCSLQGEPTQDTDTLYDSAGEKRRDLHNFHVFNKTEFLSCSSNGIANEGKLVNRI